MMKEKANGSAKIAPNCCKYSKVLPPLLFDQPSLLKNKSSRVNVLKF